MKKHLPLILSAAACLLAALCLVQVSELNDRLNSVHNDLATRLDTIPDRIGHSIQQAQEAEPSLLASWDCTFGDPDVASRTVPLTITIIPKEIAAGDTAQLTLDGEARELTLADGAFTLSLTCDMFAEVSADRVALNQAGVLRTEMLYWSFSYARDYLPVFYGMVNLDAWDSDREAREDTFHLLDCQVENTTGHTAVSPVSATLIAQLDGVTYRRIPLSLTDGDQDGSSFHWQLDETFTVPWGGTLQLYWELVDENDLHYRLPLTYHQLGEDGSHLTESLAPMDRSSDIYDGQGNLLLRGEGYW